MPYESTPPPAATYAFRPSFFEGMVVFVVRGWSFLFEVEIRQLVPWVRHFRPAVLQVPRLHHHLCLATSIWSLLSHLGDSKHWAGIHSVHARCDKGAWASCSSALSRVPSTRVDAVWALCHIFLGICNAPPPTVRLEPNEDCYGAAMSGVPHAGENQEQDDSFNGEPCRLSEAPESNPW